MRVRPKLVVTGADDALAFYEAVLDVGTPVALTDHQVQEALNAWGAQP
ncbi:hypothetical protein [Ornithinimicrobium cerasi]|uniref:Uncharacterized protein n=1 Tax=Ornithinimicrobium cerasi TaxID=2248773 RepID=A0A285VQR0_9MICO|nr:hypothetical protein [Ornithinimicrobium cerasi]SOC56237.1 hypothetical protein SAMN05421879_10733 [Ornithinimicrobium cerasi]